jgi:hypothetical protein
MKALLATVAIATALGNYATAQSLNYCTPGTSASGCQATLSAVGTASSTAPSGFLLTAANVEGDKDALFFFGVNGRQANSWGSGTSFQCVVPPVIRGGLLNGVGTPGLCDGTFSQDLNALWCPSCPNPLKNPGAGALVQAQLWYRDPFNTSNQTTSLSNAIEFCVDSPLIEYFKDVDGDGFGVTGDSQFLCAPTFPYTASVGGDCCDNDSAAFPGQTVYFSSPTNCGGWDYDCNGSWTRLWTQNGGCSGWPGCNVSVGWSGSVASCGQTKAWYTNCSFGLTSCNTSTISRTQRCR